MEYFSYSFSDALQQEWHWGERYAGHPNCCAMPTTLPDRLACARRHPPEHAGQRRGLLTSPSGYGVWKARRARLDGALPGDGGGPLSSPNVPDFPGLEDLLPACITRPTGPMSRSISRARRVGIIGTGLPPCKAIPVIAEEALRTTVFQRTAAYAVPARNGPLDPALKRASRPTNPRQRFRRPQPGACRADSVRSAAQPGPRRSRCRPRSVETAFEERWQIGGFGFFSRRFATSSSDERANELAA